MSVVDEVRDMVTLVDFGDLDVNAKTSFVKYYCQSSVFYGSDQYRIN